MCRSIFHFYFARFAQNKELFVRLSNYFYIFITIRYTKIFFLCFRFSFENKYMPQDTQIGKSVIQTIQSNTVHANESFISNVCAQQINANTFNANNMIIHTGVTSDYLTISGNLNVNNNATIGTDSYDQMILYADVLFSSRTKYNYTNISGATDIKNWPTMFVRATSNVVVTLGKDLSGSYQFYLYKENPSYSVSVACASNVSVVSPIGNMNNSSGTVTVIPENYSGSFRITILDSNQSDYKYMIDNLDVFSSSEILFTQAVKMNSDVTLGSTASDNIFVNGTLHVNSNIKYEPSIVSSGQNILTSQKSLIDCNTSGQNVSFEINNSGFTGQQWRIHKTSSSSNNVILNTTTAVNLSTPNGKYATLNPGTDVSIIPDGYFGSFTITNMGSGTWIVSNLQVYDSLGVIYHSHGILNNGLSINTPMDVTSSVFNINNATSSTIKLDTSLNNITINIPSETNTNANRVGVKYKIVKFQTSGSVSLVVKSPNITLIYENGTLSSTASDSSVTELLPSSYYGSFELQRISTTQWLMSNLSVFNASGVNYVRNGLIVNDTFTVNKTFNANGNVNIGNDIGDIITINSQLVLNNSRLYEGTTVISSNLSFNNIQYLNVELNTENNDITIDLGNISANREGWVVKFNKTLSSSNRVLLHNGVVSGSDVGNKVNVSNAILIPNAFFGNFELVFMNATDGFLLRGLQVFNNSGDRYIGKSLLVNQSVTTSTGVSSSFGYNFQGTSSGIRYNTDDNTINFINEGSTILKIASDNVTANTSVTSNKFIAKSNGTNTSPAYSFENSSNTGLYFNNNQMRVSANGTNTISFTENDIVCNKPLTINFASQTPTNLGISFASNTGLYSSQSGSLDVAVSGNKIASFNNGGLTLENGNVTANRFISTSNGSSVTPCFAFNNDPEKDTGLFYQQAPELLRVSVSGKESVWFQENGIYINDGSGSLTNYGSIVGTGGLNSFSFRSGNNTVLQTWNFDSLVFPVAVRYLLSSSNFSNYTINTVNNPYHMVDTQLGNVTVTLANDKIGVVYNIVKIDTRNSIVISIPAGMVLYDDGVSFTGSTTSSYMTNMYGILELMQMSSTEWIVKTKPNSLINQNLLVQGSLNTTNLVFNGDTLTGITGGNNQIRMFASGNDICTFSNSDVSITRDTYAPRFIATATTSGVSGSNATSTKASFSFNNDTNQNTGLYYDNISSLGSGEDQNVMFLFAGGDDCVSLTNKNVNIKKPLILSSNLSFIGDTQTGLYSSAPNVLNITSGGNNVASISTNGVTFLKDVSVNGTLTGVTFNALSNGTNTQPAYLFSNDVSKNSGMYYTPNTGDSDEQLSFSAGGVEYINMSQNTIQMKERVMCLRENQSASSPALIFNSTSNSAGIFSSAQNNIDVCSNNQVVLNINENGLNVTGGITGSTNTTATRFLASSGGDANNPAFTFAGATATGMFWIPSGGNTGEIAMSVAGITTIRFTRDVTYYEKPILVSWPSTISNPYNSSNTAIFFNSIGNTNKNTGIWGDTVSVRVSSVGTERLTVGQGGVTVTGDVTVSDNAFANRFIATASGTNSQPSFVFSADNDGTSLNTGMYYLSDSNKPSGEDRDTLKFSAGGVEFLSATNKGSEFKVQVLASSTQTATNPAIIFNSTDTSSGIYRDTTNGDISISKSGVKIMGVSTTGVSLTNLTTFGATFSDTLTTRKMTVTDVGSQSSPAIQFGTTLCGIYLSNETDIVMTSGGNSIGSFTSQGIKSFYNFSSSHGTNNDPSYSLPNTAQTTWNNGMFYDTSTSSVAFSNNGNVVLSANTSGVTITGNMTISGNMYANRFLANTSGSSVTPSFSFGTSVDGNTNTGMYYKTATNGTIGDGRDILSFSVGGSNVLEMRGGNSSFVTDGDTGYIVSNRVLSLNTNSNKNSPAIIFGNNTTGIYGGADSVGLSVNGTERLKISGTESTVTGDVYVGRMIAGSGTNSNPSFVFNGDSDKNTGLYYDNTSGEALKISVGGTNVFDFTNSKAHSKVSVSGNTFSFSLTNTNSNVTSTNNAGNDILINVAGASCMRIESNKVTIHKDLIVSTNRVNGFELNQVSAKLKKTTVNNAYPDYKISIIGLGNKVYMRTITSSNSDQLQSMNSTIYVNSNVDMTNYVAMWCHLVNTSNNNSLIYSERVRIPIRVISQYNNKYAIDYDFSFQNVNNNNIRLLVWKYEHKDASSDYAYASNLSVSEIISNTYSSNFNTYTYSSYIDYTYSSAVYTIGSYGTTNQPSVTQNNEKTNVSDYNSDHKQVKVCISKYIGSNASPTTSEVSDVLMWKELSVVHDTFIEADFGVIDGSSLVFE